MCRCASCGDYFKEKKFKVVSESTNLTYGVCSKVCEKDLEIHLNGKRSIMDNLMRLFRR